jgi:hypothetical protein
MAYVIGGVLDFPATDLTRSLIRTLSTRNLSPPHWVRSAFRLTRLY